jgi:hypothetical protein
MRKNIIIIVLLFALIVIAYKYSVLNGKFNIQQSESNDVNAASHGMNLEYGEENSYVVKSKDDKLLILFVYNNHGLKLF